MNTQNAGRIGATILTAILLAGAVAAQTPATDDPAARIKQLESSVAALEARMTTLEVTQKMREEALTKRVNDLEAAYTRSLERIADLVGESPEQIGYAVPAGVQAVIAILNDSNASYRDKDHALVSIASLGKEAIGAVPTLVDVLRKDKNAGLRCRAATTLGGVCSASSGPLVGKGIRGLQNAKVYDTDPKVRELAQSALISIMK